ncbi:hypothetical protein R6Q57_008418 [Mikania cordata]
MVKACEVVELQISSSKDKAKQAFVEDDNLDDADDAVVVVENAITTIPFLEAEAVSIEAVLVTLEVVNTPPIKIKIKYERKHSSKIIGEQLSTLLFITNSDTGFYKVIMESLFPCVYIHIGVLDAFVHVLSEEEKQRGPGSPFRIFFPPNILPLPLLEKGVPHKTRKELFDDNMGMLLTNLDIKNFNKIDFVFIPIIHNEHVLVLVFDMKNPAFEVIENKGNRINKA